MLRVKCAMIRWQRILFGNYVACQPCDIDRAHSAQHQSCDTVKICY